MKPLINYNFKDCRKILFYPIFIFYILLSITWIILAIFLLVTQLKQNNAFYAVLFLLTFLLMAILCLFYALGLINSRLTIYDYRIIYTDFLKREYQFKVDIKDSLYKAQFYGGFMIYNLKTNSVFKTYSIRRTFYLNRLLKEQGIQVKTSLLSR